MAALASSQAMRRKARLGEERGLARMKRRRKKRKRKGKGKEKENEKKGGGGEGGSS